MTRSGGFDTCFGCICEAASRCDRRIGCDQQGTCGLFQITRPYWIDAGSPLIVGDSATKQGGRSYPQYYNDPLLMKTFLFSVFQIDKLELFIYSVYIVQSREAKEYIKTFSIEITSTAE